MKTPPRLSRRRTLLASAGALTLVSTMTSCSSFGSAVARHQVGRESLVARDVEGVKISKRRPIPENAEITDGFWVTCREGFVSDAENGGCKKGVAGNPTTIVEIPGSSGRWGAKGSDDDGLAESFGRDDFRGCCSSHDGIRTIVGGQVICNDGSRDASCSF